MTGVYPADREKEIGAVERLRDGEASDLEYRVDPTEEFERWVWVQGEPVAGESSHSASAFRSTRNCPPQLPHWYWSVSVTSFHRR